MSKAYGSKSSAGNVFVVDNQQFILYRHDFSKKEEGKTKKHDFFHVTSSKNVPVFPTATNSASWTTHNASEALPPRTRQHVDFSYSAQFASIAPVSKKRRELSPEPTSTSEGCVDALPIELDKEVYSYWNLGDARKLFAPKSIHGANCDVRKVVLERIENLERVNCLSAHWRTLIDGGDQENLCSENDIFVIRTRCLYLACALRKFFAESMDTSRMTWQNCVEHSIQLMNDLGIEMYTNWRTLANWHRRMAYSPNATFYRGPSAPHRLPPFFRENPDAMDAFKQHGVCILKQLSVEEMHTYVHEILIPTMVRRIEQRVEIDVDLDDNTTVAPPEDVLEQTQQYLKSYRLSKISMPTIARWMHATGFRYKTRGKHYFVDGHEKPETLAYRPIFTKRYLAHELNAHRWVQVSLAASKVLEEQGCIAKNCGYNYKDSNNVDMVEYHVDASSKFENMDFGGQLSVRRQHDKPIVMFIGQDEAIFKQFLFLSKMWIGPNGERPLLPKDEGAGVMISSFICREYGLIQHLSEPTLEQVNANREGTRYSDEDAAVEVFGSSLKKPLTKDKSPFLHYFDYGENKEGYWDYNHMVLQFEDVLDCLKVMHPNFHSVFLFDHSSGHAKQRPDGLSATKMNKSFGGKSPPMRPTLIEREAGFLGPYTRQLQPGQTQQLIFGATDAGPFWMSPKDRILNRLDQNDGDPKVSQRNKAELIVDLQGKGVSTKGKNKQELIALCNNNNITITHKVTKIKEGWVGTSSLVGERLH